MASDESGPFKGRVGRWAIQELRLWEGLYREPTPAGSVRHIKNRSYEGRFLEARELHQTKDVNINTTAPRPQNGHHKSTTSTASTTAITPITPIDELVRHPTLLAANRATANQRRAFRGTLRRAATEPATFPRNESGPLGTNGRAGRDTCQIRIESTATTGTHRLLVSWFL